MSQDNGVLILSVASGSPAARASLRLGDLIESINGDRIQTAEQVQAKVEANGLANALKMNISRNGQTQSVSIRPVQLPVDSST